jgi:hypothetical protein
MDAGEALMTPKAPRDAVQGEQDLLGLPTLVVEKLL